MANVFALPLSNSHKFATVDIADKDITDKVRTWSLNGGGHVGGWISGNGGITSLHRLLLADELAKPEHDGKDVDHINRDKLDNRRVNLRIVSRSINQRNRMRSGSSRFPGVSWYKSSKKWKATIVIPSISGRGRGRSQYLGKFTNEKDAARAYRARAKSIDPALDFEVWKELDEEPACTITSFFKTA